MNINLKATNIGLTRAIDNYVRQKMNDVSKFIRSKDPKSINLYFEIEKTTGHHKKGNIFRAEANLIADGKKFRVEATEEDLYVAVDVVKEELVRVIKEYKDKKRTILRKGGTQLKKILRGG